MHPEVVGGLNRRPGARLCRRPAAALGQGNALRLVEDDTAALPPTTSGCTDDDHARFGAQVWREPGKPLVAQFPDLAQKWNHGFFLISSKHSVIVN